MIMRQQIRGIPLVAGAVAGSLLVSSLALAGESRPSTVTCEGPILTQSYGTATTSAHGLFLNAPFANGTAPAKPVMGAPYSAVGTTQTVQTTADGNRITHTNTMHYFRDSNGRTRNEYSLSAVGPFTLEAAKSLVTISDPASGQQFVLHPELKRADALHLSKNPPSGVAFQSLTLQGPGEAGAGAGLVVAGGTAMGVTTSCSGSPPGSGSEPASTVSLGERTIEGLKASGTRVEQTIPAGEIGNELPITLSSEQWFSKELGVVLSRTQHDPLIGDTTYHLEHIQRTEPDPALFKVPSDYTVQPLDIPVFTQPPATAPAPQ
jgi:hypothetical protein